MVRVEPHAWNRLHLGGLFPSCLTFLLASFHLMNRIHRGFHLCCRVARIQPGLGPCPFTYKKELEEVECVSDSMATLCWGALIQLF